MAVLSFLTLVSLSAMLISHLPSSQLTSQIGGPGGSGVSLVRLDAQV
jgi:hypothetical protein